MAATLSVFFNARSGSPVTGPAVTDRGDGTYFFTPPSGIEWVGLLDFGAGTSRRYMLVAQTSLGVFAIYDATTLEPVTGATPTWLSWWRVSDGTDQDDEPPVVELGGGVYKTDLPEDRAGLLDVGAGNVPQKIALSRTLPVEPTPQPRAPAPPAGEGGLGFVLE